MERPNGENPNPQPSWLDRSDGVPQLAASRHLETGRCVFPRVPATSPAAPRYEPVTLSSYARLYSHTVIHPNPKTGRTPFALVYADFPEGVRVFGPLDLPEGTRPVIGARLEAVIDESADGNPRYVFVPAEEAGQ
ncbi:OB-fold domain-containing protein [Azospirillum sp.]|uniref:Zn-ribbon domain-containing OB-fold protein n=1 Tax=Azospirillum sp. TaxID=34012 RepID=UPI002D6B2314|nr:OB-fold domain-containing protein [Azospirillum sp.]HYF88039.1 OB-fold domain-containing protein [Azospirillum sp.]